MSLQTHPKICETIRPIFLLAKWCGIMPLIQCANFGRHSNVQQCIFRVSKFWCIFSIFIQIFFVPFTIILIIDFMLGFSTTDVLWNAMKIMFIIHEIELYVILILGVAQAKEFSKILNHLSRMQSKSEDLKWIGKFLKFALAAILLFFALYSSTHVFHIYLARNTILFFSVRNFSRCIVGLLLHNYLTIFTQIQCLVSVMLCLLICSKFKYLSNLIEFTFNKTTQPFFIECQSLIVKTLNTNVSRGNRNNTFKIDADYLEELHSKYCEISDCFDEINKRIGFQLLISISVILYTLIFFLFCEISVEGYNNDSQLVFASIFGTFVLIIRMSLYLWAGHKIKKETGEPLTALQRSKVLHYPQEMQQQIQTMLLQWSSIEPGYLTAFNIMNVGPWLLTSIIGNVITYLLVFIQISKANGN